MVVYTRQFIVLGTARRVLLDQLVFSPVFLAVFFLYSHVSELGRLAGVSKKFESV